MQIEAYRNQLSESLKQRTLVFLIDERNQRILLGYKKRGFGESKLLGIGGKKEENETIEQAAVREGEEEIGVTFLKLLQVAVLDFYFPYVENPSKWNQQVIVFTCSDWKGEPKQSDEIRPNWFSLNKVPYHQMWSDYIHWFPRVLAGQLIKASFLFNRDLEVEDSHVEQIGQFHLRGGTQISNV